MKSLKSGSGILCDWVSGSAFCRIKKVKDKAYAEQGFWLANISGSGASVCKLWVPSSNVSYNIQTSMHGGLQNTASPCVITSIYKDSFWVDYDNASHTNGIFWRVTCEVDINDPTVKKFIEDHT